jgi:predicted Zn-dependent protease
MKRGAGSKEQRAGQKEEGRKEGRSRTRVIFVGIAVMVVLGAGAWWWHAGVVQARVVRLLPVSPDLATVNAVLRERVEGAEAKARGRTTAQRGMGELAQLYHVNGFLDAATRTYAGLRELEPDEPRWPHLEASIHAGFGDLASAVPLWRRTVELAPDYLPARIRLGDALLKMNQPAEATAAYEQVLQRERDNAYALFGLARLDLEAERWDSARARLEQVVRQTNYALGYDLIVSLYERLGLNQRALAVRARAKASGAHRDPPDPWLDGLIELCLDPYRLAVAAGFAGGSGDIAQARRLLERALDVSPDDISARFQLGMLLLNQRETAAAEAELRRCTEREPTFADAWAHLSSLQANQGRADAAAQTLATGLKHCPGSPGLHLMMARSHRLAGRSGPAVAEFQESIRLRPNEPEAYLELGQLHIREGRKAEGLAEIRRALAVDPGNTTALSILAFDAITSGTEAEARAWYARVAQQPRMGGDQLNQLAKAFQQRFGKGP